MAKAAWCTVSPTTGENSKTINVTLPVYTGRTARNTTITVQNKNGTKPSATITANQTAAAIFVTKVSSSPASLAAENAVLTVTGKSNAKMIRILEGSNDAMTAHEFKVNGVLQTDVNGDATTPSFRITGDPGSSGEYTFESKITVYKNDGAKSRTLEFYFEGYNTDTETGTPVEFRLDVPQAGSASKLSVDKASLTFPAAGSTQAINLTSNDEWAIS